MTEDIQTTVSTFFETYPLRTYTQGEVITRPGQPLPGILYILDGEVIQYDISSSGEQVIVNTFKTPAFFSMSHVLVDVPNTYFFAAETPVTAHCAPHNDVLTFIRSNPDVTFNLLTRVYRGTEGVLRRLANALGSDAATAIRFELLTASKRFGSLGSEGINIRITHQRLAERTGLTRETVSRELENMAENGLIKLGYGIITIPHTVFLVDSND